MTVRSETAIKSKLKKKGQLGFSQLLSIEAPKLRCSVEPGPSFQEESLWYSKEQLSLLVAQMVKNLPVVQETQVRSLDEEDPLEKGKAPTPGFLPVESHGQRNLAGYSPWGLKESDMTEQLTKKLWLFTHHLTRPLSLFLMFGTQTSARVSTHPPHAALSSSPPKSRRKGLCPSPSLGLLLGCLCGGGAISLSMQPQLSLPNALTERPQHRLCDTPAFSYLEEPAFKIHDGNLPLAFPLVHAFLQAQIPTPSLPPFVHLCQKTGPDGFMPKAPGQLLQPGPFTGQISSLEARIPRSSWGRAGLFPKEVALSGPSGGDAPQHPEPGPSSYSKPFPLVFW